MYKILPIGGKDYKLEYTIEASLYGDCTESLIDFIGKTFAPSTEKELTEGMTDEEKLKTRQQLIKNSIKGISNLPKTALTIFYAGLMEYHGTGKKGDKTVCSIEDAKEILWDYFTEHESDGTGNYYDLLAVCLEQMGEDGFFDRSGLKQALGVEPPKLKRVKEPQDHKKPSGK